MYVAEGTIWPTQDYWSGYPAIFQSDLTLSSSDMSHIHWDAPGMKKRIQQIETKLFGYSLLHSYNLGCFLFPIVPAVWLQFEGQFLLEGCFLLERHFLFKEMWYSVNKPILDFPETLVVYNIISFHSVSSYKRLYYLFSYRGTLMSKLAIKILCPMLDILQACLHHPCKKK